MTDDDPIGRRRVLRSVAAAGLGAAGVVTAAGRAGSIPVRERRRSSRATRSGVLDDEEPDAFAGDAPTCDRERTDDEALPFDTDGAYGGWGGHEYHGTEDGTDETPVVFVHGNTDDACAFDPHAAAFLDGAYVGDELWSITFREETTTHPAMADQLEGFVEQVHEETGADAVDVVAHSLGVTGARYWMDAADRYDDVGTFVGMAGANHGTWVCGPGCEALPGAGEPCQFVSPGCAEPGGPLYELNTPDETPGDVDYYTIRGGADVFFLHDRESPTLDGAENVELEWHGHDAARESEAAVGLTYEWLLDG